MSLIKEVKEFFESYEVLNTMFDKENIKVSIFEASSRKVLQVQIIEKIVRGTYRAKTEINMFCDVKVESNLIKMTFKYRETKLSTEFFNAVKTIKKNDYVIKTLGNQITISIIEPRIEEVSKIFSVFEPLCRKLE